MRNNPPYLLSGSSNSDHPAFFRNRLMHRCQTGFSGHAYTIRPAIRSGWHFLKKQDVIFTRNVVSQIPWGQPESNITSVEYTPANFTIYPVFHDHMIPL